MQHQTDCDLACASSYSACNAFKAQLVGDAITAVGVFATSFANPAQILNSLANLVKLGVGNVPPGLSHCKWLVPTVRTCCCRPDAAADQPRDEPVSSRTASRFPRPWLRG